MTKEEIFASVGWVRLRNPRWAFRDDYIRIYSLGNGGHGIWGYMHSRQTSESVGGEIPVVQPFFLLDEYDWNELEFYEGETYEESQESQATVKPES